MKLHYFILLIFIIIIGCTASIDIDKSLSDCNKLGLEQRDSCIHDLALQVKDVKLCSIITYSYGGCKAFSSDVKTSCYEGAIIDMDKDEAVASCNLLNNTEEKDNCFRAVANKFLDFSLCKSIRADYAGMWGSDCYHARSICRNEVARKILIQETDLDDSLPLKSESFYAMEIIEQAEKTGKENLCNLIPDDEFISIQTGANSRSQFTWGVLLDECIIKSSKKELSLDFCSRFEKKIVGYNQRKLKCVTNLAIKQNKPSLCKTAFSLKNGICNGIPNSPNAIFSDEQQCDIYYKTCLINTAIGRGDEDICELNLDECTKDLCKRRLELNWPLDGKSTKIC